VGFKAIRIMSETTPESGGTDSAINVCMMDELGLLLPERTGRRAENSQAENPCPTSQADSILLKFRQRITRSASKAHGEEGKDFSEVLLVNDFVSDRFQFGRLAVEGDGETRRAGHINVIKVIADKCAFVEG